MNRFLVSRHRPLLCLALLLIAFAAPAQTYTQTEEIVYSNNTTKWVLGQVAQRKIGGVVVASSTYDPNTALPLTHSSFGALRQTLTWNANGTVATVKDGNNNVTTVSNWKRGIPQTITYPATTDQPTPVSETATVNDFGWITSVTDETRSKTCYAHDAMGRINRITYPSESAADTCNASAWNETTLPFEWVDSPEYGIAAGHWRQTITTGNGKKFVYFDALWRPLLTREYDATNEAATRRFQRFAYDQGGRTAFASYPGATDALTSGTWTEYDALDRVTSVSQDSELTPSLLVTTTEYLDGFRTRVTNPRTNSTTTYYKAYDQPATDWPMAIEQPEGATTVLTRDTHGKPLTITRRNAGGTVSATRSYTYNSKQELCRTDEPETGTTALGYDDAGNLAWSASGYTTTATGCLASTTLAARRVDRTYDDRNRLKTLSFPDGNGNQTWTYAADSLPAQVVANNVGGQQATTDYAYNRRRLLESERLTYGSVFSWPVDYAYNANGHLSSQLWNGLNVDYAPDALGRPSKAGTFASGVNYHPNGAIKQFTYGNGIVHTLTQNARQLPRRSLDIYGSTHQLDDTYDYDPNGNVLAIGDGRDAAQRRNVDMVYDGLDRLTSATSPMFGTATYAYDVLDNLTRTNVTGGNGVRDRYYCYNSQWQLAFVRSGSVCTGATPSPAVTALEYDVQGNVSDKNAQTFAFDYGNRLRSVNTPASTYAYDGLGRRVWDRTTDDKYSHYLQNGQLSMTGDERAKEVAEYIYLQGSLIAIRERNTVTNVYTTKYQHTDALGSPVAVTDANRAVIAAETNEFEPYGRVANRALTDGPNYTGHVADAATGLVYAQQRYYDPEIGRFLSVDPVTAYENPLGAFNRYWYAANNPYKFTDPDGREIRFAKGAPADFLRNVATAIRYLNRGGAATPIGKAHLSKEVITVQPASNRGDAAMTQYDPNTHTVTWADKGGIEVNNYQTGETETMSPALALGHEFEHVVNKLEAPDSFRLDSRTPDSTYDTQEERNVIEGYERPAAESLGEGQRGNHSGRPIEVKCPTPECK